MSRTVVKIWTSAGIAAALVVIGAGAAIATEVVLRLKSGDLQISGELVSSDKTKYTINSRSLGSLTLDAAHFDCISAGCPKEGAAAPAPVPAAHAPEPERAIGPSQLSISGSNTVGNLLMPALIDAYAAKTGTKLVKVVSTDPLDLDFRMAGHQEQGASVIALHRHGSATAFTDLAKQVAQVGMSSRPIKADEAQKLIEARLGDMRLPGSEHILALDGLVVLVAPDSPVVSLPMQTIVEIFSGQITDWSQLGLPAGPINVYAPTPESGTFDTFDQLVLKANKVALTPNAKRTANHAEQSDWVAHDPLGIGFAGIAYQRNSKAVLIQSSCGLTSSPSVFSMKTEDYPLARRLFLYTSGRPRDPLAQGLLDFALSQQAQTIVKQSDFIDQIPELAPYSTQADRIANSTNAPAENFDAALMATLTDDLKSRERLSVTFRFQTASSVLDNKALADVKRLVELLKSDDYVKKSILLAGFADSKGLFSVNAELSRSRAKAVLDALRANGLSSTQSKIIVKGYGELAPVACNDTQESLQRNRRVEVWVR
ncbi:MAG: phosphate ABC transporter substrate-binding/OmpA family protein [Hyphomicrobium sp.]|jgi:phosphate transport system substrate-binding protein